LEANYKLKTSLQVKKRVLMVRYLIVPIGFIVWLAVVPCWAAEPYTSVHPDPMLESWRWRSFPELKGHGLTCLAQDAGGNMWFGTEDGVWKYDGTTWSEFSKGNGLDGKPVTVLATTETGKVYAATELGIYEYLVGRWARVFPPAGNLPWFVSDLNVEPNGDIWAGTVWGAVLLRGDTSVLHTTQEIQRNFERIAPYLEYVVVPQGIIRPRMVTYQGMGIQRIGRTISWVMAGSPADSTGLRLGDRIVKTQQLQEEAHVSRLTIEREGETGTRTITVHNRPGQGQLHEFEVMDICRASDGMMWFAVPPAQILRLDRTRREWRSFTPSDGLDLERGCRLAEMRDGSIWAVSQSRTNGVNRFDGTTWSTFRLSDFGGTNMNPSLLQTADGTIWIGGHEGIFHAQRDGHWYVYRTPEHPLPETRIVDLVEGADGALWIAGQGREPLRLDYGTDRWATYEGLNFECQTADGHLWFLARDDGIVRFKGKAWTRYGVEDGLMDSPVGLVLTREGDLWAVGSQRNTAASARLESESWDLQVYPRLSWGIDGRTAYQASDGAIWFGAAVDWVSKRGHRGGVLRLFMGNQVHYTSPEVDVLRYAYGIGQTADGSLWEGSYRGLHVFDGTAWTRVETPEILESGIEAVYASRDGELWLGHRTQGVFRYDGHTWTNYDVKDGLADNTVRCILESRDGTVWVVSARGTSRFDGTRWTTPALPADLYTDLRGSLRESRDGALWINMASDAWHRRAWPGTQGKDSRFGNFRTVRYQPDSQPPETTITLALERVSQPGNTTVSWAGTDPWHRTSQSDLLYAWQLDEWAWSPFSAEINQVFQSLDSGSHVFRVRARDRDFNVDPTPAEVRFVVIPPVWQQLWFLTVMALLVGAIALQTIQIIRRDRRLRETNLALSDANEDLANLNSQLQASNQHLRDTQEQLILQEKMASLGNLVAGVAHEFNTPLGALNCAGDVLRRCIPRIADIARNRRSSEMAEDADCRKALKLMEESTQTALKAGGRLSQIVDSMRNFARLDESDFQQADLHEGLDSILVLREHDLGHRITVISAYGELPRVACYPGELNQVFMNILSNAIEAIEGSGEIRIETSTEENDVCIAVSDTGRGIPQEHIDQVFDPGFTAKGVGVGTGLGLAICYRIVQKHKGTIAVSSEVGKGSTFTVRIPMVS
jgi:signal transduction histidine kinase/ligand-binding sensor domain-containing protein